MCGAGRIIRCTGGLLSQVYSAQKLRFIVFRPPHE